MTIFAILSTLGYGALRRIEEDSARLLRHERHLERLQLAVQVLEEDLADSINRPVRDRLGARLEAFVGNHGETLLEVSSVTGTPLQLATGRSRLARIAYRMRSGTLYRLLWPVLDRAHATLPREEALLDGIRGMRFRFLGRRWHRVWPPATGDETDSALPRAVELVLELSDGQRYRRLFLVHAT